MIIPNYWLIDRPRPWHCSLLLRSGDNKQTSDDSCHPSSHYWMCWTGHCHVSSCYIDYTHYLMHIRHHSYLACSRCHIVYQLYRSNATNGRNPCDGTFYLGPGSTTSSRVSDSYLDHTLTLVSLVGRLLGLTRYLLWEMLTRWLLWQSFFIFLF